MRPEDNTYSDLAEELNSAIAALDQARQEVVQARDALLAAQHQPAEERTATLRATWQRLADVSIPMVNTGGLIISVIQTIGREINAEPSAPDQLEWLTGVNLSEKREERSHGLRERTSVLLTWLNPYLERVSPRTRNAVVNAITRSANGYASPTFAERLTPETFAQELRQYTGGLVGNIEGIGQRGLRELRAALEIPDPDTPPSTGRGNA